VFLNFSYHISNQVTSNTNLRAEFDSTIRWRVNEKWGKASNVLDRGALNWGDYIQARSKTNMSRESLSKSSHPPRYLHWNPSALNTNNKMRTQGKGARVPVTADGHRGSSCWEDGWGRTCVYSFSDLSVASSILLHLCHKKRGISWVVPRYSKSLTLSQIGSWPSSP
jgi:hypothetical protein